MKILGLCVSYNGREFRYIRHDGTVCPRTGLPRDIVYKHENGDKSWVSRAAVDTGETVDYYKDAYGNLQLPYIHSMFFTYDGRKGPKRYVHLLAMCHSAIHSKMSSYLNDDVMKGFPSFEDIQHFNMSPEYINKLLRDKENVDGSLES